MRLMVDESQPVQNLQCISAWSDHQLIWFLVVPNLDYVPLHSPTGRALPIYAWFNVPGVVDVNFLFILPA